MTRRRKQKNWLEWTVFAAGFVLSAALLGYLAWDALQRPGGRPIVQTRLGAPVDHGGHFAVPVFVTNRGDATAEGVLVEVELTPAEGEPERSEFELQFLPSRAERKAWVTFSSDPGSAKSLEARVLGYREP